MGKGGGGGAAPPGPTPPNLLEGPLLASPSSPYGAYGGAPSSLRCPWGVFTLPHHHSGGSQPLFGNGGGSLLLWLRFGGSTLVVGGHSHLRCILHPGVGLAGEFQTPLPDFGAWRWGGWMRPPGSLWLQEGDGKRGWSSDGAQPHPGFRGELGEERGNWILFCSQ